MIRSVILILVTLGVLAGAFAIYELAQSPAAKSPLRTLANSKHVNKPSASENMRGIGGGDDVWMKRYDTKTGELASQFKGQKYEPQKDNTVNVTRPQAEFFSKDGRQRIRIEGDRGNVVMRLGPKSKTGKMQAGEMGMPSRGRLHDVRVSIFEPVDADRPQLVARMNNAAFDIDTFRINTEAFTDAQGDRVEADQVPVTVRGIDYDFDGKGLIIRWNERDSKLQLLEIAHGNSLVIKHPSSLNNATLAPTSRPAAVAPSAVGQTTPAKPEGPAAMRSLGLDEMLASSDPQSPRLILAAAKPKKHLSAAARRRKHLPPPPTQPTTRPKVIRDLSPVVYEAMFDDNVKIFEADQQVAKLDKMTIDLLQQPSHEPSKPGAANSSAAVSGSASGASRHGRGARGAATTKPATLMATTQATTQSATRPGKHSHHSATQAAGDNGAAQDDSGARGPVTVKWTGKLRIVPLEGKPDPALVVGKAIVHMIGSPAVLTRDGTTAECANAVFNSADGSATLNSSPSLPVVTMTDTRGSVVKTPHLDYGPGDAGQRVALLIGKSEADMPIEGDANKADHMTARWSDRCKVTMVDLDGGRTVISHADLLGGVSVNHPQLDMTSDALTLNFDLPATTRPTTREVAFAATKPATKYAVKPTTRASTSPTTSPVDMVSASLHDILATGNVDCHIKDPQDQRTIKTHRLLVETDKTDSGQTYAKYIQADGDVQTSDNGKELRAAHLEARLAPSTQPANHPKTPAMNATTEAVLSATAPAAMPATMPSTLPKTMQATGPATTRAAASFGGGNIRLVSMIAEKDVHLTTPEGTKADADRLTVEGEGEQQRYVLVGHPSATVTDGKTTIVGPMIRFDPDQKLAQIVGPGMMHGIDPKNPKQNVDIAWQGGAVIDGATDWIDVDQKVVLNSIEADGTRNAATAKHLRAKLMPRPPTTQSTTRSSTRPANRAMTQATDQPAVLSATITTTLTSTRPAKQPADESMSFMKDKDITLVTLTGDVEVKSELPLPDGSLARGMNLLAQTVNYDRLTGEMTVPVEGEMLYQDHRGATTGPTTRQNPTVGGGRGATAFKWTKSLDYNQSQRRVVMIGNVRVVHHPDDAGGEPFDLKGQTLTAEMEPDPSAGSRPTTKASSIAATTTKSPATNAIASIGPTEKMRLKHLTVDGDVHVTSTRLTVDAVQLSFDPVNDLLIATGTDDDPVVVFDHATGSRSQADKLEWNTQTDDIKLTKFTGKIRK